MHPSKAVFLIAMPALAAIALACGSTDEGPTGPVGAHPITPIPGGLWRPTPPALGNWMLVVSEPGDWVGQGKRWVFTPDSSPTFILAQEDPGIVMLAGSWLAVLVPMRTVPRLMKGYYPHAVRFGSDSQPGMAWGGDGRGCNSITGWFVVDSVQYAGDTLTSIQARAEQYCDGGTSPLHGALQWSRQALEP